MTLGVIDRLPPSGMRATRQLHERRVGDRDRALADHVAEPAGQEHRRQRGDERLHLEDVDHEPDEQAEHAREHEDERDHHGGRPPRLQQARRDHAAEGHDRADREVDAARQDDERHADREHDQVGVVDEQVEEHLPREEAAVAHAADDEDDDEEHGGHRDRSVLRAGQQVPDAARQARAWARAARASGADGTLRRVEELRHDAATPLPARMASLRRKPPSASFVVGDCEQADDRHDRRLEHHRRDRRDADRVHRRDERLDDEGADEGADERVAAAGERRAADHDGEDRVELDEQARVVGVGRRPCWP